MFKLQFDPECIPPLARQYLTTGDGFEKDLAMQKAGAAILEGERTRARLEEVYRWKAARALHYLAENTCADICQCLTNAVDAKDDDRAAVTALICLHGVRVPVASAILTAIFPERFTVIDYKALASLGCPQESPGVGFYLGYLRACRVIAQENKTSLRTLDRALWQWWTNQERSNATP